PREPAPALVGPPPFRRGRHPRPGRDPRVRAAQGLAPAQCDAAHVLLARVLDHPPASRYAPPGRLGGARAGGARRRDVRPLNGIPPAGEEAMSGATSALREAVQELHQYLSDRIAPLMFAYSMEVLLKQPPALVAAEIRSWSAGQGAALPNVAFSDLL